LAIAGAIIAVFTAGLGAILGVFAVFGLIIIIGAAMMYSQPGSVKTWGIVILVLGILSLFGVLTALGGILSLVGGILAMTWKPSTRSSMSPPSQSTQIRVCTNCGREVSLGVKFCPHCGKAIPE
jgi:hypothetical protein